MSFLFKLFPFLNWFRELSGSRVRADLLSGVTVALVLIPQSMAYAQLAGLPAYYGLYAAFLPPMVASLFGSSHQLATGPVAVVSLMTSAALEPLATAGSAEYISYAILLALLVGIFQFALGLLRLGLIVNFLSHPVVNGFTNAAALIIGTSQLSKIFGVYVDKADHHYETIYRVIVEAFDYTHLPTLGMAILAFTIMLGLRRLNPRIPNVLVAVVVTIVLSWAFGFEKNEQVSLPDVQSPRFRELVTDYNRAVADRIELERLRASGNKAVENGLVEQKAGRQICISCHGERNPEDGFLAFPSEPSGNALALHHLAGVLDLRIQQLKLEISTLRSELRSFHFEATETVDGILLFHVQGQAPQGRQTIGGTWRVTVGSKSLNEEGFTMMGGGAVVAKIPPGLPTLAVPEVNWGVVPRLFFMAMIISLLGFMEAISIAKAMATRTHQRLDPNQELLGQGLANIVGCLGQSYAVSGSFSRSAVNLQAGAKTGMSNVFSSGVVIIVLLFFTPLLYHLPQAVLASIIMMAVFGLLNVKGFVHAWKAQAFDGITGVVSFVATLMFAPHLEYGIFIGVLLSLGAYLYRTMKPHIAELSLHSDGSLRDARRHGLALCRHIAAIRFDGSLNFANATYLEDEVLKMISEMPDLRHVFIAAHGINEIDASGEETLSLLVDRVREAGYEISFSGIKEKVQDALVRTHLYEKIGPENIYPTQKQGLSSIYAKAHLKSGERGCPLEDMKPHVVDLALHPDGSLRDAARHKLALCRHVAAIRFDSPLNLATSPYLEEKIKERVASMPRLSHVLIAAHGMNDIDSYGIETLRQLVTWLRSSGIKISFSGLKESVLDILQASELYEIIGAQNMYPTQLSAVRGIHEAAHEGSDEKKCPLVEVVPVEHEEDS